MYIPGVSLPGSARNKHGIKHTRGCCKNVLHRSAVFFTRQCKERIRYLKHTRGCFLHQAVHECKEHIRHSKYTSGWCKIVLQSAVSLLDSARNTHGIQNTPEGVVRLYYIGLLFLHQAVQGAHTTFKIHRRVI